MLTNMKRADQSSSKSANSEALAIPILRSPQSKNADYNKDSNPVMRQLLNDELSDMDGENDTDYKSQSDIDTQSDDSTNSFGREVLNTELVLLKNEAKFSLKQLTFYQESTLPIKRFSYGQRLINLPDNELNLSRNGKYIYSIPIILQILSEHYSSNNNHIPSSSQLTFHHISQIKIQIDSLFQLIIDCMILRLNNDKFKDNLDDYWELINVFKAAKTWLIHIGNLYSKLSVINQCVQKTQYKNIKAFDLPFLRRIQKFGLNLIESRNLISNEHIFSYFEPYVDPLLIKLNCSFPIPRYKYVIFSPSEDQLFGIGLETFGRAHLQLIRKHFLPHRGINEIRKRKASLSRKWDLYQEKFHPFYIWKANFSKPFKCSEDIFLLKIVPHLTHSGTYDLRNIISEMRINRDFYIIFKRLSSLLENISRQMFLYGLSESRPIEHFLKGIHTSDSNKTTLQPPEQLYSNSLKNSLKFLQIVSKEIDLVPNNFYPRCQTCHLPAEMELEPLALAITKLERYVTGEFNNINFLKIGSRDIRI